MRCCHSVGPVLWTLVPPASTATVTGTLAAASFVRNATGVALDANDYIIQNTTTGALMYDADGSGVGAAVQFATLSTPNLLLTNQDFIII